MIELVADSVLVGTSVTVLRFLTCPDVAFKVTVVETQTSQKVPTIP